MLVLTRKPCEKVVIGNGIILTVLEVDGNRVQIGVEAPEDVRILRAELGGWQEEAGDGGPAAGVVKPRGREEAAARSEGEPVGPWSSEEPKDRQRAARIPFGKRSRPSAMPGESEGSHA